MQTENIVKFLAEAYSDERLAALLAHAQDGKLSFCSCCCFIGITNAPHALRGYMREFAKGQILPRESTHHQEVRYGSELADSAETEFALLGESDEERRALIIPLAESEILRREQNREGEKAELIFGLLVSQ